MTDKQNPNMVVEPETETPVWIIKWAVAIRPFSLTASTMPVIFGSVLASTIGDVPLDWLLFLSTLLGMAMLHAGANLLNDVWDYKKGIDRQVNPASGAVVRKWISLREASIAGWLFLSIGSLLGLFIFTRVGLPILWLGLVGVAMGIFYTWGPFPLKYNALGDLAVFLTFGILGALGSWIVQAGAFAWVPMIWAVPMSLLVVGILHANNWRDIRYDKNGGIRTVAGLLGDRRSESYYSFLIFGPFAFILILIFLPPVLGINPEMPSTFLLVFLTLPLAFKIKNKGKIRHKKDFLALDAATAKLNLLFGLLCVAALGLNTLIKSYLC
jgi:1,4-dihydroxy-2-naphthoate octaprenyltransferase